MVEDRAKFGACVGMFPRQRRNTGPARGRFAELTAPFEQLREPDVGHQMALIGFEGTFEGRPLAGGIIRETVRLGEVEP